jgi:1-phosphofructokinase family hexose kinase
VILTVTPSPALDMTWHVDALTPGATHRAPRGATRAGGKGLNVARILHAQGHDVLALTTLGRSHSSEFESEFDAELAASGMPHRLIPVTGPTRRSLAIVDDTQGETTILNEFGAALTPAESAMLAATASRLGRTARAVAISGSLPPGFGPEQLGAVVGELVGADVPVVVDTSGAGLLAAARAGAHALKPNSDELEAATGHVDPVVGARSLLALGARLVVLTLGRDGLVLVDRAHVPLHAHLPRALHGNATGAGDAVVAAITAALAAGTDLDGDTDEAESARTELARRATAWSASAVLMRHAGELSPDHTALEAEVAVSPIDQEP